MIKNKFKFVLKCIAIFTLMLLFLCTFSYTLIVYLSIGRQDHENEIHIARICHPYARNQEITFSPTIGILLENLSVTTIYTDHSMCLDVLLPAICQLLLYLSYPKEEYDMSGSGDVPGTLPYYNSELQEECSSVLPKELLTILTNFSTDYEDITCANGFYLLNNTCRPHCTQFEQIYHNTAMMKIGSVYFATIFNIIFTILFIVAAFIKRKSVLKFPSILMVYIVILYSIWPICILINLLSGRALLCSDDDLVKSLKQPSVYCIISGILSIISPAITILWLTIVAVLFWKFIFPLTAMRYHKLEKWIHALAIILVVIYVIPFVVTTMADEDFYFVQSEFPSFFCLSRNAGFNFGYLLFPSVFLSGLGFFLLIFILFHIQLKYGCSIWRHDDAMNAAEKKLLLLSCFVGVVSTLSGVYYTLLLSHKNKLQAALNSYLLCELPGSIVDNTNNMTICSKDEIEKYSYTDLSIVFIIFSYALLPLVFLLAIIEWRYYIQKMTVLMGMKNDSVAVSMSKFSKHNNSEIKSKDSTF